MFGWIRRSIVKPATVDECPGAAKDEAAEDELLEAEKVLQVRSLCNMACKSAEAVAKMSPEQMLENANQYDVARYQVFLHQATKLTAQLADQFYRDAATEALIYILVTAGDARQARKLFYELRVRDIRDELLRYYPNLAEEPSKRA
jgi:hypothetical protein